jgi:hypothetical protein
LAGDSSKESKDGGNDAKSLHPTLGDQNLRGLVQSSGVCTFDEYDLNQYREYCVVLAQRERGTMKNFLFSTGLTLKIINSQGIKSEPNNYQNRVRASVPVA